MSPTPRRRALGVISVAVMFAVSACSTGGNEQSSAASTEPSVASPGAGESDQSVQGLLDAWAAAGPGGVAVAFAGDDGELTAAAAGNAGPAGGKVVPDSQFRVGSLSKTFVAVMLLQLVADGTIGLDDLVTEHAPELTIAEGVTIRQLLAHRSGIPEHTDSELAPAVLADPARTWTPTEVLDLVADQPHDFAPDERFAYSNSNYIVAGLLLETVTGMTLAANLDTRIVEPLALTATYFAPDNTRSPIGAFSTSLPGGDTNGVSYHALETAAGAAGALVSTAPELATFLRALAHGELLDDTTYAEMTRGLPDDGQTLGIFASDPPTPTGISNSGAIPGYLAYMQYDPSTEDCLRAPAQQRQPLPRTTRHRSPQDRSINLTRRQRRRTRTIWSDPIRDGCRGELDGDPLDREQINVPHIRSWTVTHFNRLLTNSTTACTANHPSRLALLDHVPTRSTS